MYSYELCRQYQEALLRKDLAAVLELFMDSATVKAPISGTLGVKEFHTRLFSNSRLAIARLTNVFDGLGKARTAALQFSYTWILKDGRLMVMDGVSIFEIAEEALKFRHLTIVYDSASVRKYLNRNEIESTSLG